MNLKNYIFTLLCTLVFSISCTSQQPKQTYTSKYALGFNITADSATVYQWVTSPAYSYSSKTASFPQGNSALLTNLYLIDDNKGIEKSLNFLEVVRKQRILLPTHNEEQGKVSFTSMGGSIDSSSYVTVKGISSDEKILFSKNIMFQHKELKLFHASSLRERVTISAEIPLTDVKLLTLSINVKGEKEKDAIIVFCKLDIFIGDQHIDEFPIRELQPIPKDIGAEAIAIDLESNTGFDKIDKLKNSKIIGLGESIHGSGIVNKFAYKLIMQQVETLNCKLILLERRFEKILPYNRYIMDEDFILDKEHTEDTELIRLVEDLRSYNSDKSLKDKVRIFGVDYNYSLDEGYNTLCELFDYVTVLNCRIRAKELDQFALLLMNFSWNDAFSFLRENRTKMEKYFPFGEYEAIMHIIKISKNMGTDIVGRIIKRDSIMFVNSKFLIDRFSPDGTKAIIYGHSGHISPISNETTFPATTFGRFMKEEYSLDYSPLSILVGEGYNMAIQGFYTKPSIFTKKRLSTPPANSMEYYLNSLGKDFLYLPLTSDFNRLVLSRNKGSNHLFCDFYPFNLHQRYNGVFFIKNIESASEQEKDVTLNESRKKIDDKHFKRQKIAEEIKKRRNKRN